MRSFVSASFAQYTLTVDTATAVDPALGTTYRFYINLEDATDQVSAVYGNNQTTLAVMRLPVYNSSTTHGTPQESTQHFCPLFLRSRHTQ